MLHYVYTMLCIVLLAFTLTGRCQGNNDNSSTSAMLLAPHLLSAAQAHSLRRQLMRDNYDYQPSDEESQPTVSVTSGATTNGETDHVPRASELTQTNSNAYRAESAQQGQSKQLGKFEQPGKYGQGQHNQPGEYVHRAQYERPGVHEERRHYQQPEEHEQHARYDPHDRYEQHTPQEKHRQHKRQHDKREQQDQHGQNDEEEHPQSIEQKYHAAPILYDAPPVDVERDWRDFEPEQAQEYNPSDYNKKHDTYGPPYPALIERKPFSNLRGNYKEQYGQNVAGNDMRPYDELVSNAQESPDQEFTLDEQEAFDQWDESGTQNDEVSEFSESKNQAKIYNEFAMRSNTRANRPQYYTTVPDETHSPSPHHAHSSLNYYDSNTPLYRSHNKSPPISNTPSPHRAPPQHRNAPPPHRNAPNHNISKKDLLYYMDDSQLRRRNYNAFPEVPDEDQTANDQLPSPQPSPGPSNSIGSRISDEDQTANDQLPSPQPSPGPSNSTGSRISQTGLPRTSRSLRSFVVTVSANNVTYKLLTLKSRSGRRQDDRRILEERGPAGVALMSLDHAPLPAFRLPRSRRQYMHAPHRHYRHELA